MTEISINKQVKLSQHFTLGELTKSRHAEVYNIPSHVAIENLKRVCGWLEELRRRYNQRYVLRSVSPPKLGGVRGGLKKRQTSPRSDHPLPLLTQEGKPSAPHSHKHTADYIVCAVPLTTRKRASDSQYARAKGCSHQPFSHQSCRAPPA